MVLLLPCIKGKRVYLACPVCISFQILCHSEARSAEESPEEYREYGKRVSCLDSGILQEMLRFAQHDNRISNFALFTMTEVKRRNLTLFLYFNR